MIKNNNTWKVAFFCNHCNHELTSNEKYYNHGICHYCGNRGEQAITVVDSYEMLFQEFIVKRKHFWKFWEPNKIDRVFKQVNKQIEINLTKKQIEFK